MRRTADAENHGDRSHVAVRDLPRRYGASKHLRKLGNKAAVRAVREQAAARAADLGPILEDVRANGLTSVRRISEELNRRGILTSRGAQ